VKTPTTAMLYGAALVLVGTPALAAETGHNVVPPIPGATWQMLEIQPGQVPLMTGAIWLLNAQTGALFACYPISASGAPLCHRAEGAQAAPAVKIP
jgi:hypothetical protein